MIYPHKMYKGIKKLSLFKIKYIDTANKNDNAKLNTCTRLNLISTTFHSLSLPSFLCLPHAPASTLAITCTSTSTYTYIYIYIRTSIDSNLYNFKTRSFIINCFYFSFSIAFPNQKQAPSVSTKMNSFST